MEIIFGIFLMAFCANLCLFVKIAYDNNIPIYIALLLSLALSPVAPLVIPLIGIMTIFKH